MPGLRLERWSLSHKDAAGGTKNNSHLRYPLLRCLCPPTTLNFSLSFSLTTLRALWLSKSLYMCLLCQKCPFLAKPCTSFLTFINPFLKCVNQKLLISAEISTLLKSLLQLPQIVTSLIHTAFFSLILYLLLIFKYFILYTVLVFPTKFCVP